MNPELCGAIMTFGDDYGDNQTTMHCNLAKDHSGFHCEKGTSPAAGQYTVVWEYDERKKCERCGKLEAVGSYRDCRSVPNRQMRVCHRCLDELYDEEVHEIPKETCCEKTIVRTNRPRRDVGDKVTCGDCGKQWQWSGCDWERICHE